MSGGYLALYVGNDNRVTLRQVVEPNSGALDSTASVVLTIIRNEQPIAGVVWPLQVPPLAGDPGAYQVVVPKTDDIKHLYQYLLHFVIIHSNGEVETVNPLARGTHYRGEQVA